MFGIGSDSAVRPLGREHFPVYPKNFFGLTIAQLVVAIIILGLDAYGLSYFAFSGNALNMFTVLATIITCVYILVAEFAAPKIFNYWAVLGLDILLVVFWLISFALIASQVAPFMTSYSCDYYFCYSGLYGSDKTFANCMAAVAGLGGLEFILFIVSLAVHALALHSHRKVGLHCMPGAAATAPANVGGEKAVDADPVPLQPVQGSQLIQQPAQQQPYYEQQAAVAQNGPVHPAQSASPAPQQVYTPVERLQAQNTGDYHQQPTPQQVPVQQQQAQPIQAQSTGGYSQPIQAPAPVYEAAATPYQHQQ